MSEKQSVTVRIAGEEHTLRSNAAPEYTIKCAEYVDERVLQIKRRLGMIEGHKAAILAALSITDELLQAREGLEETRTEVIERAEAVIGRLTIAAGKK